MAKVIKMQLTAEQLAAKIATLTANIEKLKTTGMEDMAAEFQSELDSLNELESKQAGISRADEFIKLFGTTLEGCCIDAEGSVTELNEEQKTFIGDKGITVKLLNTGKLEFVRGAGSNTGGSKTPSPYTAYHIPYKAEDCSTQYEVFTRAAAAAGHVPEGETAHPHSVLALLKTNGVTLKLAEGDSMRREIVKLNKKYNLGVKVTLRSDDSVIDLKDSTFETATKEEETAPAETTV